MGQTREYTQRHATPQEGERSGLESAHREETARVFIEKCRVREVAVAEEAEFERQDIEALIDHPQPPTKRRKTGPRNFQNADRNLEPIASHLGAEFSMFTDASATFPPEVTPEIQRGCLNDYLQDINNAADRGSCGCCGAMIQSAKLERILFADPILAGNKHEFDICAIEFHPIRETEKVAVDLCSGCLRSIRSSGTDSVPKFSATNDINTTLCQHYPECLKDLTLIEQFFISRAQLIGYVLRISQKGKPGISYRSAAGHIMAFKQDPSNLLSILPSAELEPYQFITVSWEGKKRPSDANLLRYCQVRKAKVLAALQWLCKNNPVYKDVRINTELLATWSEDPFIPPSLLENAAITEPGLSDNRDGYARDIEAEEEDAAFEQAQQDSSALDPGDLDEGMFTAGTIHDPISIATGALLTDQEGENISMQRRNAMLFAQLEKVHEDARTQSGMAVIPNVKYNNIFGVETFNSWTDPDYLLAAFPTVFPYGTGGHFQPQSELRPKGVSLEAFANWIMRHHNFRAARHHVLPFVLYDMILLRQSSLGNNIQSRNDYWARGQVDMLNMTSAELKAAALEMKAGKPCTNPVILRLLGNMRLISSYNPESFGRKLAQRHVLFGHVVRFGCPAFWFTINPQDFRNPVILRIAGVEILPNLTSTQKRELRQLHAVGNPALVAEYFHIVVDAFFKKLLRSDQDELGILGSISNHFGVVESNTRLMHHLHGFAWLTGNLDFDTLGERVLASQPFRNRMAAYMQTVVTEMIDLNSAKLYQEENPVTERFVDPPQDPMATYNIRQPADDNFIASKCQMHSHNATCYKYGTKKPQLDADGKETGTMVAFCRFRFPKSLFPKLIKDPITGANALAPGYAWIDQDGGITYKTETGEIKLSCNNEFVNKRNPIISSALRSNHDLSFIPGTGRMLAALYYMFNYSTKDDVKMHQLVLSAAMFKNALEKAAEATGILNPAQQKLVETKTGDFAMKVYHRFQREREVGAVTIASFLMQQPAFYMPNEKSRILHYYQIKTKVREFAALSRLAPRPILQVSDPDDEESEDEEHVENAGFTTFKSAGKRASFYTHYQFRGPRLKDFCAYEYFSQIGVATNERSPETSFPFDPEHPYATTHRQYSAPARMKIGTDEELDGLWIPAMHGAMTDINSSRASIQQMIDDSPLVQNDIDECLLGLFYPWDKLTALFTEFATDTTRFPEPRDACSFIWNKLQSTLAPHLQRLANNVCSLRRSKEQAAKDRADRQLEMDEWEENCTGAAANQRYDAEFGVYNDDEDGIFQDLSIQSFQHGFREAMQTWRTRCAGLGWESNTDPGSTNASLLPSPGFDHQNIGTTFDAETAGKWEELSKQYGKAAKTADPTGPSQANRPAPASSRRRRRRGPRSGPQIEAHLSIEQVSIEEIKGMRLCFKTTPTLATLIHLIGTKYTLNKKQLKAVIILLKRAMSIDSATGEGYKEFLRDQHLIYIAGAGGTGKTLLISGFLLGMEILDRVHEVLILAPTGSAACHVGGQTLHAALGVSRDSTTSTKNAVNPPNLDPYRHRLKYIKFIIIDEISMVGQKLLESIDKRARALWSVPTHSDVVLGGMPMVITLGDFRQFKPVADNALWAKGLTPTVGERIWSNFSDVMILTEQMRQKDDVLYQELLSRASNCCLTDDDLETLNSRTRQSLEQRGEFVATTAIRPLNLERHNYNRLAIERFAKARNQKVWMFAAKHSRTKASSNRNQISVGSLLSHGDDSNFKGPGVFFFTPGMPVMLLANISTATGLANGKRGVAVDVVLDKNGLFAACKNGFLC